jgi:hypothetical protein
MVLALMYLEVHEGRAWKGYPRDVLNFLFDGGLIADPTGKAKSVVLTESGLAEAKRCFTELLAIEKESGERTNAPRPQARGLPDIQRARVDSLLGPMCQLHPDPQIAAELRCGYRVEGADAVLFESRPSFLKPEVWAERPVQSFA